MSYYNSQVEFKMGLEAEFLIGNKKRGGFIPTFPRDLDNYISHDDYELLVEVRGKAGGSAEKVISNFYQELMKVKNKLEGATIYKEPWLAVPIKIHEEALFRAGVKNHNPARNIGETSAINPYILEDGKPTHYLASCGLHLHFSINFVAYEEISGKIKGKSVSETRKHTLRYMPKACLEQMVRKFDEVLFPPMMEKYVKNNPPLPYRVAGYYEPKYWGFEYRSLPFSIQMFPKDIEFITQTAWDIFMDACENLT